MRPILVALMVLAPALSLTRASVAGERLTLFAAASLKNAVTAVTEAFLVPGCPTPRVSFAGSQTLALQIERGAPADIVITADEDWMDYLQERDLLVRDSRQALLSNSLVVVAPRGLAPATFALADLAALVGSGRLALANTSTVPAGRYARAALEAQGLWARLQDRTVQGESVRTALAFVARGESPAGIVYATDASAEPAVDLIATLPPDSHPPIRYPVAAIAGSSDCATAYITHLRSEASEAIFRHNGFVTLNQEP